MRRKTLKALVLAFSGYVRVRKTDVMDAEDVKELDGLIQALVTRDWIPGIVKGFGSYEPNTGRNYPYVVFLLPNEVEYSAYMSEDDLKFISAPDVINEEE
jgi:hypothetical protein